MGNQVAAQRSLSSDRSSRVSSYLSRRGSRKMSLTSPHNVQSFIRSALGQHADADGSDGLQETTGDEERIPSDIEKGFELAAPIEGKMHRNLCECAHPHTRVDIMSVLRSSGKRTLYVDRQICAQASGVDVAAAINDLRIMCYLATLHGSPEKHGHPHIIQVLGHFLHVKSLHVITKYYELGNLWSMMHTSVKLKEAKDKTLPHFRTETSIRAVVRDIVQGVAFIHRSGVAHLDLALENVYIGLDGRFRIGDFRHARFVGSANKRQASPVPARKVYAAPELYSGREVDLLKADAWSLGVIVLMILTMETPFAEATIRDPKYQVLQLGGLPKFLADLLAEHDLKLSISQDMVDLLSGLLCCNPEHRTTVFHTLEIYPWLQPSDEKFAELVYASPESKETSATQHLSSAEL